MDCKIKLSDSNWWVSSLPSIGFQACNWTFTEPTTVDQTFLQKHKVLSCSEQGGPPARAYVPSIGTCSSLSQDAYRQKHQIIVSGDNVPPRFTSFEETGFPFELLRDLL
ncbi:hypothetical protein L1887_02300 [Cichorium endivia]|nr:hypothetical protein L1887_02300 [Cichorium endivia]